MRCSTSACRMNPGSGQVVKGRIQGPAKGRGVYIEDLVRRDGSRISSRGEGATGCSVPQRPCVLTHF